MFLPYGWMNTKTNQKDVTFKYGEVFFQNDGFGYVVMSSYTDMTCQNPRQSH